MQADGKLYVKCLSSSNTATSQCSSFAKLITVTVDVQGKTDASKRISVFRYYFYLYRFLSLSGWNRCMQQVRKCAHEQECAHMRWSMSDNRQKNGKKKSRHRAAISAVKGSSYQCVEEWNIWLITAEHRQHWTQGMIADIWSMYAWSIMCRRESGGLRAWIHLRANTWRVEICVYPHGYAHDYAFVYAYVYVYVFVFMSERNFGGQRA